MLKLAGEHNVDLDLVEGTGLNGRITRKDILKLWNLEIFHKQVRKRGSGSGSSRSASRSTAQ